MHEWHKLHFLRASSSLPAHPSSDVVYLLKWELTDLCSDWHCLRRTGRAPGKVSKEGAFQAQQQNLNPDPNINACKYMLQICLSDLGAGITKKSMTV